MRPVYYLLQQQRGLVYLRGISIPTISQVFVELESIGSANLPGLLDLTIETSNRYSGGGGYYLVKNSILIRSLCRFIIVVVGGS